MLTQGAFCHQWARLRARSPRRRDSGVVAVLTALLLGIFLGMAGFVLDVGHWYLVKAQTQKAADAAALAGAAHLPNDEAGAATDAKAYAAFNGFSNGGATTVTSATTGIPGQYTAQVSTKVDNWFTGVFGVPTTTITSSSNAEYIAPVRMGSPCNRLGDDPNNEATRDSTACPSGSAQLWVDVNSPETQKGNGDPIQSTACTVGNDNCVAGTPPVNTDYRPEGYFYDITVKKRALMTIELFDAVFVGVGDSCDASPLTTLASAGIDNTRYAVGSAKTSPYCSGDKAFTTTSSMTTTFTMHGTGSNPNRPQDNPLLASCPSHTYPGYNPQTGADFVASLTQGNASFKPEIFAGFRKWVPLCTVTLDPGTYPLQVQSAGTGANSNRFSIRAVPAAPVDASTVSVAAHEAMTIFANGKPGSQFYLARVPSAAAGRVLHVRLFDVGDCVFDSCAIRLISPNGSTVPSCVATGAINGTQAPCAFPTKQANFNGHWADLAVPVPASYSCADATATACWYKVEYTSGDPLDTTAWTAQMPGLPVRLLP